MASLESIIKNELAPAFNAGAVEKVVNCFADDAVVTLDPPIPGAQETFRGKREIRNWAQMMVPGARVQASNIQTEGDHIKWGGTFSNDLLRKNGVNQAHAENEAVVKNGKIVRYTPTLPHDVASRLAAGTNSASHSGIEEE